jgi:hypothetical protein
MMDSPDCFALMLEAGNQADCARCAISWEEVVIVPSRWRQKARGVWRCLAVEKLNHVELHTEAWHTGPRSKTQTGIDEVDFVAEVQPGDDPQKGQ